MGKSRLDRDAVIRKAAELANETGSDNISLKELAGALGVRSPSLYNHVDGLEDVKRSLMLYGWSQLEQRLLRAAAGYSGYDAFRSMCREFFSFSRENPGLFNAMLWYNKYSGADAMQATAGFFIYFYRFTESVNISRDNAEHILRTLRGFLEGFSLLVNNGSFGHSADITESFELSLDILIAGIKTLEGK